MQLERGRRGEAPDLLLDVSELRVDEISLEGTICVHEWRCRRTFSSF